MKKLFRINMYSKQFFLYKNNITVFKLVFCDFLFGTSTTKSKVMQSEQYCKDGDIFKLDIVANYGWIRSEFWNNVEADMKAVCKVGADSVKTSTGFYSDRKSKSTTPEIIKII